MKASSLVRLMAAVGVAAVVGGCGSASNNDQGVAFTSTGFYSTDDEGVCQEIGITALPVPLTFDGGDGGLFALGSCIGLQNNMSEVFVRTDRAFIEYYVEGAAVQPPSTSTVISNVLGPVGGDASESLGGTLPSGFDAPNRIISGITVLPVDVQSWLALNRELLPEPPYGMRARIVVSGLTSAGDRLESNPSDLLILIGEDREINPPAPEDDLAGLEDGEFGFDEGEDYEDYEEEF